MQGFLKPSKQISGVLAAVATFSVSSEAIAFCAVTEVERELSSRGISVEEVETRSTRDYGVLRVWKDGNATRLFVDNDGDLTFRTWYNESWSPNLRLANDLNDKYKYISAHIDQDGDLELSYYVVNFSSGCPDNIHRHTKFWWTIVSAITDYLNEL